MVSLARRFVRFAYSNCTFVQFRIESKYSKAAALSAPQFGDK